MELHTALFFLVSSHVITDYGIQGFEWFKPGNDVYTSVSGCNIELNWNLRILDHGSTITKEKQRNTFETPEHKLNDDERYVIHTTETKQGQDISMVIMHVTVEDSGVYRCNVDYTDRHKDVNLTIIDFKWMSNKKSIQVQEGEDIDLEWKYVTQAIFKHIFVYRISFEENSRKQYLGKLKTDNIDNQGERLVDRASVTFNKDGNGVVLTLRKITEDDVKYNYFIELVYSDSCSAIGGPNLLNKASKVYSHTSVIKVRLQEDINFVWYYEYISPVITILFTRRTPENKIDEIGYWHDGEFLPTIPNGENRIKFNKTERNITNGIEGQITLTLLDASRKDFNYDYICRIIFHGKEESSWTILLEEKAPQIIKDDSALSTGAVAGIIVTVVFTVVIVVVIIVIILFRQSDTFRQKITSCIEGNHTKTNQEACTPLRELNLQSQEDTVDPQQ